MLSAWPDFPQFDNERFAGATFEACHKIKKEEDGLHIACQTNIGKSCILRSIKKGLINSGRMRCQVSDNFAFGSSVDETLIYTDEMWFTTNNVEEAKCILKCTKTYIRAERKNTKACRLVTQNHGALLCKKKTPLKTDFSTMRQDNQ